VDDRFVRVICLLETPLTFFDSAGRGAKRFGYTFDSLLSPDPTSRRRISDITELRGRCSKFVAEYCPCNAYSYLFTFKYVPEPMLLTFWRRPGGRVRFRKYLGGGFCFPYIIRIFYPHYRVGNRTENDRFLKPENPKNIVHHKALK